MAPELRVRLGHPQHVLGRRQQVSTRRREGRPIGGTLNFYSPHVGHSEQPPDLNMGELESQLVCGQTREVGTGTGEASVQVIAQGSGLTQRQGNA